MLQSAIVALFVSLWTIALIGIGAQPNPWLTVQRGGNYHALTYRSRSRRLRYTSAWGNGQTYRSIELLTV